MTKPTKDANAIMAAIMNAAIDKVNKMDVDGEPPLAPFSSKEKAEFSPIETAIAVAVGAHKGQKDKAGAPYILHPLRLMFQMETEEEMIVAVLHDVIEDGGLSVKYLTDTRGFDRRVAEGVESVTRRDGESYEDFVVRAGLHPLGSKIKYADILDNMNLTRIASLTERDLKRVEKYHLALGTLKELQTIRKSPVQADFFQAGGNVHAAKVTLVPRGFPYPHTLNTYGSAGTIIIDFDGIVSEAVMPEDYLTLRKILMCKDPAMLYGFNPYWAPFFCPECQEVYPYEQWDIKDDVYGTCPQGHRRRLEDR